MASANEETPKKSKSKKDPSRFLPPGIYFRGKFIGIEHVADACGDRSDMMCQVAMAKMKAAIKTLGDHKRKIIINISINGIKLLDEKDEDIMFDHPLARISYISRDISDSRAFGYVFNPGHDYHEFYGIKTEKAAEVVVSSLRDLFHMTSDPNKGNTSLPENSSKFDQSWRMHSPPYSLKHGALGEGGTLGRFKKSPHLLYRFYNTVSNTTTASTGSPRKQGGFLTSYSRQSSAPTNHPPATSLIASAARNSDVSSTLAKTPSLSSSSSSNQNVNNSPSASAIKSPMSILASKKSLSSVGSLPVIESPPTSPTTLHVQSSRSGLSKDSSTASYDEQVVVALDASKLNTLEEADSLERQSNPIEDFPSMPTSDNLEAFKGFDESNQMSWANFEEFEYSDESEGAGHGRSYFDKSANHRQDVFESDSSHRLSGEEPTASRKSSNCSALKNSHLFLSCNGIDPFIDDPFFSNNIDISFDSFKIDDDVPEFDSAPTNPAGMDNAFREEVLSLAPCEEVRGTQQNQFASENNNSNGKPFEDNYMPKLEAYQKDKETSQSEENEEIKKDINISNMWQGGKVQDFLSNETPKNNPEELKCQLENAKIPPETSMFSLPPPTTSKPILVLKSSAADDYSPTSPSTNPSEFPSPDIPPPPLPFEVVSISMPRPTPPPLPPRRPQWQKIVANPQATALVASACSVGSTSPATNHASDKIKDTKIDVDSNKKLDTASILKLFSAPTTSSTPAPYSTSTLPPFTTDRYTNVGEEPTYGNLHPVFAENNNMQVFHNSLQTYSPKPASLVPAGIPDRRLSPNMFSFHSYSLTGRNSEQDQPRSENFGFPR